MGQVSGKFDPNPPNVESKYILTNYIKPRSTWIKGRIFLKKKGERLLNCNLILELNLRTNT